ncbi:MAG: hypothetical protein NC541_15335 [bacterium]|nr:hypothetical protein [bacterium]
MEKIKETKPGDVIRERTAVRGVGAYEEERHSYRVVEVYPHHVLTADTVTGLRRCICYGDLIVAGLERQSPVLEAMRKEKEGSERWQQ